MPLLRDDANLDAAAAAMKPSLRLPPLSACNRRASFLCLGFSLASFVFLFRPHSLFSFSPGCNFPSDIFAAQYSSTFLLNLGARVCIVSPLLVCGQAAAAL